MNQVGKFQYPHIESTRVTPLLTLVDVVVFTHQENQMTPPIMHHQKTFLFLAAWLSIAPPGLMASESSTYDNSLHNITVYIPSQCYTKTETDAKKVQNPCYVCHTRSEEPNYINDQDLQETYSFAEAV